ncbi:GntR family transcriptional regulator, partial [Mycobacteroides abscessus subsp. abscessus]|uniref:GntR family transcriptional regulator n=1 Tax=Mycobacteroides abscessus TaxID=36809 RepID=UPI0019CFDE40
MPVPPSEGIAARSLLRDNAYKALRTAIVDGTLAPGERLRDDELSRWLGVSRTPIREALARLEQAGLVQTQPGRHTIVSPIDVREARAAQSVAAAIAQR